MRNGFNYMRNRPDESSSLFFTSKKVLRSTIIASIQLTNDFIALTGKGSKLVGFFCGLVLLIARLSVLGPFGMRICGLPTESEASVEIR